MTTATAKTIQIYLPTGEPRGIRIADITTRLVLAVLIPRSELAAAKQRWELDHPGIYFLFGEDDNRHKHRSLHLDCVSTEVQEGKEYLLPIIWH